MAVVEVWACCIDCGRLWGYMVSRLSPRGRRLRCDYCKHEFRKAYFLKQKKHRKQRNEGAEARVKRPYRRRVYWPTARQVIAQNQPVVLPKDILGSHEGRLLKLLTDIVKGQKALAKTHTHN